MLNEGFGEPQASNVDVLDGFKRARAARALGWPALLARVDAVNPVETKLRLARYTTVAV